MLLKFAADVQLPNFDICVVGAGPVGIAFALACEAVGLAILLVESGGLKPNLFSEELSRAEIVYPRHHVPMREATCRTVGGTSLMWGRCCVPYDNVDFTDRIYAGDARWPIAHDEISAWYEAAAKFFRCGAAQFGSEDALWPNLRRVMSNELARWARKHNVAAEHRARL
jgi:choline dehydrogenase-like flavoprotein